MLNLHFEAVERLQITSLRVRTTKNRTEAYVAAAIVRLRAQTRRYRQSKNSTKQTRYNSANKIAKQRYGDCRTGLLYFCSRKIYACNVKDRFATAVNAGRAPRNITVNSVLLVHVGQDCKTSAAAKRSNQHQLHHLARHAQQRKRR